MASSCSCLIATATRVCCMCTDQFQYILKFIPGCEAWGNKAKGIILKLNNELEHNMLIHPTSKIGAWVLLFHPALLSFSFLVIL